MIKAVTNGLTSVGGRDRRGMRWRVFGVGAVILVAILGAAGWGGARLLRAKRYQVRVLRQAVEASAAPDELVVVDNRFLGWALLQGSREIAPSNLRAMNDNEAPSSLLTGLEVGRREIVVVAPPTARLLRVLSAAGYVVTTKPGNAPWDTPGRGGRLLRWGEVRIFFVRPPGHASSPAKDDDGAVSSEMQHEMK